MFSNWSSSEKTSLFVVTAINLPLEIGNPESESKTWSYDVLSLLSTELGVSESYIDAYLPIVLKSEYLTQDWNDRMSLVQPFMLNLVQYDKVKIYIQILMFLIVNRFYDSRGRQLVRNLRFCFNLTSSQFIGVEVHLSKSLLDYQNALSHKTDEKDKKSKYMRYAKIGVAAVGAGAVLALTGGLAAPAIAGALVVMGSSSAAAAVSVTAMATIFGSVGAGLTGYKMTKRTKGLQEFEFEQYDSKGQVAVIIMVSGWLENEEDYKRSFGIVPKTLNMKERLTLYYQQHCPDRIATINEELEMFENDPDRLYGKLHKMFGKDPMHPDSLIPPFPEEINDPNVFQFIEACIEGKASINPGEMFIPQVESENTITTQLEDPLVGDELDSLTVENRLEGSGSSEATSVTDEIPADLINVFDNHLWSWRDLNIAPLYEMYLLKWEVKLQMDLGHSIIDMLKSLSSSAVQNVLAYTVFATLATAVMWPVLILKLTDVIDGLWTIAIERADQAGRELAKVLMKRPHGSRPVTLVGYSLGSRVIFTCLKELAKLIDESGEVAPSDGSENPPVSSKSPRKIVKDDSQNSEPSAEIDTRISEDFSDDSSEEGSLFEGEDQQSNAKTSFGARRFFFSRKSSQGETKAKSEDIELPVKDLKGMIADVVLLGSPISLTSRHWSGIRQLVSGRLINGYSKNDKVLSIVYRYQRFKFSICGVSPVTCVPGIENIDLSALVEKHVDYGRKMKEILNFIDLTRNGDNNSISGSTICI